MLIYGEGGRGQLRTVRSLLKKILTGRTARLRLAGSEAGCWPGWTEE